MSEFAAIMSGLFVLSSGVAGWLAMSCHQLARRAERAERAARIASLERDLLPALVADDGRPHTLATAIGLIIGMWLRRRLP